MMNSNFRAHPNNVGAVVIGGDFQGLGIARSLGRHQVPVGVIDDELSISRFSRYTSFAEKVSSFGDAAKTVEILLDLARRRGLEGRSTEFRLPIGTRLNISGTNETPMI
jgi:D-aspartate ligase